MDLGLGLVSSWARATPDLLCVPSSSQSPPPPQLTLGRNSRTTAVWGGLRAKGQVKPTLKGFGTDIIHAPANQSHKQPQKQQKDPVFP